MRNVSGFDFCLPVAILRVGRIWFLCPLLLEALPLSALTFMTEAQVAWNEVGGAGIVISIPMILFAMLVQKHLVRGLTMGAMRE